MRICWLLAIALLSAGAFEPVKRPKIIGVAHIALETNDMQAADEFYGHQLGYEHFSLKTVTYYKVNDHQYIEITPGLNSDDQLRLSHIAFETENAPQLRAYLDSKGVKVPASLEPGPDGNLSFTIGEPGGHKVEFVEYRSGSLHSARFGKMLPETRVSKRIIHVGFTVPDRAAEDALFHDILGFKLMWHGGRTDDKTDWVDMRVPDGSDWLEYMLNVSATPTPKTLGTMNHLALGVESIQSPYKQVLERGMKPPAPPKVGRDGKWQLNLYDPNLTRSELMEFQPAEKPCCAEMLLPNVIFKQ